MASKDFLVGLDIGSSNTKAIAAYIKPDEPTLEVVAKVSEPSFGVRKGVVVDPETVSKIVSSVLEKVEKDSGEMVNNVLVSLGGGHIFSTTSEGTIAVSRADQVISEEDVKRVEESARTFSLPKNRRILEVFPQEYTVDNEEGVREPAGMKGVRLQGKILVLGYFVPYYENLINALNLSGFSSTKIVAKPLASAESVLTFREKELGTLVLDMGAGTTGYAVYKEGALIKTGVIPVGSFNITKDIGVGLKTDVETAEMIKIRFGACYLGGKKEESVREERSGDEIVFTATQLGRIIDARVKEIFDMVQQEVSDLRSLKLAGGVVLTGGGSNLKGLKRMSRERLGLATRLGLPHGFFPEQEDPSWSVACGLILNGVNDSGGKVIGRTTEKFRRMLKSLVP